MQVHVNPINIQTDEETDVVFKSITINFILTKYSRFYGVYKKLIPSFDRYMSTLVEFKPDDIFVDIWFENRKGKTILSFIPDRSTLSTKVYAYGREPDLSIYILVRVPEVPVPKKAYEASISCSITYNSSLIGATIRTKIHKKRNWSKFLRRRRKYYRGYCYWGDPLTTSKI